MQNDLLSFLRALDLHNVKYVSWKNNHQINKVLEGKSDLDLYVSLNQRELFLDVAIKHGFINFQNPVAVFPFIEHLYCCNGCKPIFHLHVYFKVLTGEGWLKEYDLPLGEFLLKNRILSSSGFYILNPKAQAYVFTLRHFLKNSSFSSRFLYAYDIESYRSEWLMCNFDVLSLSKYGPINLDNYILQSGLTGNFNLPNYFTSFMFRIRLLRYLRLKFYLLPFLRLSSFSLRLINKLYFKRKKVFKGKGIIIAISGVDGSGKSTMVRSIDDYFSEFLTVKKISLGKPQGLIFEFLRKSFSNTGSAIKSFPNDKPIKNTSLLKCFSLLVLASLRLLAAKKCQYYAGKGFFVLVDRWPTLEFGKMDGPKIFSSSRYGFASIFSKLEVFIYGLIPKTDVCVFLDVSVDTALIRNQERQKDDKETDSEIKYRHIENKNFHPIASKVINFDNDGSFFDKKHELLSLIFNECLFFAGHK